MYGCQFDVDTVYIADVSVGESPKLEPTDPKDAPSN